MSASLKIWSTSTAVAAALILSACHPTDDSTAGKSYALPALPATLPLAGGAAGAPVYGPPAGALPTAPRLRTVRVADQRNSYAYADDAWSFGDAISDAPPDYGFDYAGVEPWAWQGYDNSRTFAEPIADGYRYYYYRPGADTPYFVRDPDYGYGYDNGQLAAVYGAGGAILPYGDYGPRIDYASRYLVRGRELYAASRERRAVNAANWAARSAAISAAQARWSAERAQQSAWRDYHARVAIDNDRHWQEERDRRQADAQRFADWRRTDYRAAPPPRVIPAAWQQARWARDDQRYVALPARQRDAVRPESAADQQRRPPAQSPPTVGPERPQATIRPDGPPAPAGQQIHTEHDQRPLGETRRGPPQPATQPAAIGQQQAERQHQREVPRRQSPPPPGDTARAQADAARLHAQADGAAQARAAQAAGRDAARARDQAAARTRGQAQQAARAQAQAGRAAAEVQARGQALAARAQIREQPRPARPPAPITRERPQPTRLEPQARPQRPAPQPARPAPQPAQAQHPTGGARGGGHGDGHERHPG